MAAYRQVYDSRHLQAAANITAVNFKVIASTPLLSVYHLCRGGGATAAAAAAARCLCCTPAHIVYR